eukprot:Hpha_TRINITY_DN14941_c2_g15::TRINITY_DN14941_c2_g15_i2::g.143582::m.143582
MVGLTFSPLAGGSIAGTVGGNGGGGGGGGGWGREGRGARGAGCPDAGCAVIGARGKDTRVGWVPGDAVGHLPVTCEGDEAAPRLSVEYDNSSILTSRRNKILTRTAESCADDITGLFETAIPLNELSLVQIINMQASPRLPYRNTAEEVAATTAE